MKFEEFVANLRELEYAIVAMNEYTVGRVYYIYIVAKKVGSLVCQCVTWEGSDYEKVFENVIKLIKR